MQVLTPLNLGGNVLRGLPIATLPDQAIPLGQLGLAAFLSVGNQPNTVTAGDDPRLGNARIPTGTAGGDLGNSYPAPTVIALQGRSVANTAPTDQQVLTWSDANQRWQPASPATALPNTGTSTDERSFWLFG